MQLTAAEASFRALKSELSIRPVFHQLEPRVKAPVLVAFLGYALGVALKHLLQRKLWAPSSEESSRRQPPLSPARALALLSALHSAAIVLPTTDGHEVRLCRITEPDTQQQKLLELLALTLPERLKSDRRCSADSRIA